MKPHFGQSDAAMNKLAGCNVLPNNNKPADLARRDIPCSCIPCKHYESSLDEVPCKYCRDHTKFEENYVIAAHKTPKRISPISYENGFEDGYEKAKKEYSVSMSGEMYVTEENMTPEPLPEGYYGHHNGCDCAVCEDMHNTEIRRKIVDAEWNKLLDDNATLIKQVEEITERMGRDVQFWKDETRRAIEAGDIAYVKAMKLYEKMVIENEELRATVAQTEQSAINFHDAWGRYRDALVRISEIADADWENGATIENIAREALEATK